MASIANSLPNQLPPLDLFAGLSILVASALFYFSIILGGFTVRRVLDQESDFTFQEAFDRYSRLFAIPLVLTALASFFALFGGCLLYTSQDGIRRDGFPDAPKGL